MGRREPTPRACAKCGETFTAAHAKFCVKCRWGNGRRAGIPQKWFWTPERDQVLRERYDGKVKGRAAEIARDLGFPVHQVKKRAILLGFSYHADRKDWTPEEVRFLEFYVGNRSAKWIARKLGRTMTSVVLKCKRMEISWRVREGYTLRELQLCFGCDHHVIERWVRDGKLQVRRRGTDRVKHGDIWNVNDAAILRFIAGHPMAFRLDKVDQFWFMDLITNGGLVRRALAAEERLDAGDEPEAVEAAR